MSEVIVVIGAGSIGQGDRPPRQCRKDCSGSKGRDCQTVLRLRGSLA